MANKSEKRQTTAWIPILITGILIPIVAAAIPYLLEKYMPPSSLEYTSSLEYMLEYKFNGPIQVGETIVFELVVKNSSSKLEENVEVWLPYLTEKPRLDAPIPVQLTDTSDQIIVKIGKLRPGEALKLGVLSTDRYSYISDYHLERLRITSNTSIAQYAGSSFFEKTSTLNEETSFLDEFVYPTGFWAFVILLIFLAGAGMYIEYFEPRKAKEERLLKELDKL